MASKVGATPSTAAPFRSVGVLVEEGEAEDADRGRVGLELLHDQVVVLAGLDIGAVLADLAAGLLVGCLDRLDRRPRP